MKIKYEIKFWKDWLEADTLKRFKLVEGLPFFKSCLKMKDDKMWKHAFTTMLNSYFEDLESAIDTQMWLAEEKHEKSKK